MPINIYFGNSVLRIVDQHELAKLHEWQPIINPDSENIAQIIKHIQQQQGKESIISTSNTQHTLNKVLSLFTTIEAAGGIVENEKSELLFIFRRGKWDLPKGKIEANESPEIAAIREIEEETGLNELKLLKKLTETYHYYEAWGQQVIKISHWFHLSGNRSIQTTPQIEEDIEEVRWFSLDQISIPLSNTYENIKNVIQDFVDKKTAR